jgi:hypothetical protein
MIGRRKLDALDVSAIGLGCMSMTPIYGAPDADEAIATLHLAADIGIDFIDTSDAYGANGANEELVGRALKGWREKYILATKFATFACPTASPGPRAIPTTSSKRATRASGNPGLIARCRMNSNWAPLFVASSLLFLTTQIAGQEHAVLGQGNVSCGSWLNDRKGADVGHRAGAHGFLVT